MWKKKKYVMESDFQRINITKKRTGKVNFCEPAKGQLCKKKISKRRKDIW